MDPILVGEAFPVCQFVNIGGVLLRGNAIVALVPSDEGRCCAVLEGASGPVRLPVSLDSALERLKAWSDELESLQRRESEEMMARAKAFQAETATEVFPPELFREMVGVVREDLKLRRVAAAAGAPGVVSGPVAEARV